MTGASRKKKALGEGLAGLMIEKVLRNITVGKLADRIDINQVVMELPM